MIVLNSTKSGSRGNFGSSSSRNHTRSYSSLQQSKKQAYQMLKKYSNGKNTVNKKAPLKNGKKSKMRASLAKALGIGAGLFVVFLVIGLIVAGSWLAQISASLPQPGRLVDRKVEESTKIYSKDGVLLYTLYADKNREFVPLEQIPEHTRKAVLAAEDVDFYEHEGIDLTGMVSSGFSYVFKGKRLRGASTITQQLVKNTLVKEVLGDRYNDRDAERKVIEILITLQVEKTFTKDEILEMYLNEVPLGGVNYGLQAASKAYFNKDVKDLTLAESALMAGLIQSPSRYAPLDGPNEAGEERKELVFDQMEKYKEKLKFSEKEIKAARKEEIAYNPGKITIKAPHFVFYAIDDLVNKFGSDRVYEGGLKVTTSLDMDVQKIGEEVVKNMVDKARPRYNTHNGAMVAIVPQTGEIAAMVGSYDYYNKEDKRVDGQVNVTTALRQPGSSVKPITYSYAIENGIITPATILYNIPGIDFGYDLKNWDGGYRGLQPARDALADSENIPAVEVFQMMGGVDPFIKMAEGYGITSFTDRDRYGSSITLGAAETKMLEELGMYATFANGGKRMPTTSILKVEERRTGDVLYEYKPTEVQGDQVISEQTAYIMNDILADISHNMHSFFPENLRVGDQKVAEKTGTTNSHRDASAYMYYPRLAVAVWSGNNNNEPQMGPRGAGWSTTVPLPAAHTFFERVIPIYGKEAFKRPSGVVTKAVCKRSGLLATEQCKGDTINEVFIEGKLPKVDNAYKKIQVCKNQNIISTNPEYASKFGLLTEQFVIRLESPKKSWESAINAHLSKLGLFGPSSSGACTLPLGSDNAPGVSISSPSNGASYEKGGAVNVSANISTLNGLQHIRVTVGSLTVRDFDTSTTSYNDTFNLPGSLDAGTYTLTITATDTDGKTGSSSVSITINGATASINMTSPNSGDTKSSPVTLTAKVTGSATVTSVKFYDGATEIGTGSPSGGSGNYSMSWAAGAGVHNVSAKVFYSGGSNQSGTVMFTVI